jgi:indole-3-glycerol phosphate synthase
VNLFADPHADDRLRPILDAARRREAQLDVQAMGQGYEPDPERARRFRGALAAPGISLIAELKRRSPSKGDLRLDLDVQSRAKAYAAGGARALSVLTEVEHFGARATDFELAGRAGLPRLRKDFLLGEAALFESVRMGADAVLLITRALGAADLRARCELARELGLFTLVEIHDRVELDRAIAAEPDAIGVNARDLSSFEVRLERGLELLREVPERFLRVAESGLSSREDVLLAEASGADAGLVGEALSRADDPVAKVAELLGDSPEVRP